MDNAKQLKSINQMIENLTRDKSELEKELKQLKNQEKKILKQDIEKRRKEDTKTRHRKKKKRKNS